MFTIRELNCWNQTTIHVNRENIKNIKKTILNIELRLSIIMQITLLNCLSNPLFHYVQSMDKYSLKT